MIFMSILHNYTNYTKIYQKPSYTNKYKLITSIFVKQHNWYATGMFQKLKQNSHKVIKSMEGSYSAELDLKTNMIWNTPVCIAYNRASLPVHQEVNNFIISPHAHKTKARLWSFCCFIGLIWTAFHLAAEVHTEKSGGHWSRREQGRRIQESVSHLRGHNKKGHVEHIYYKSHDNNQL